MIAGLTKTDTTFSKPSEGFGDDDYQQVSRIVSGAELFDEVMTMPSMMDTYLGYWKQYVGLH